MWKFFAHQRRCPSVSSQVHKSAWIDVAQSSQTAVFIPSAAFHQKAIEFPNENTLVVVPGISNWSQGNEIAGSWLLVLGCEGGRVSESTGTQCDVIGGRGAEGHPDRLLLVLSHA